MIEELLFSMGLREEEIIRFVSRAEALNVDPQILVEVIQEEGLADEDRVFQKTLDRMAMRAFQALVKVIERVGIYGAVKFKDPRIYEVIDALGGWERVFEMSFGELRREFYRLYPKAKGERKPEVLIHGEFHLPSVSSTLKALGKGGVEHE